MDFTVNDILIYAENPHRDRVLWIGEVGIVLIDVDAKKAFPRIEGRATIEQLVIDGHAVPSPHKINLSIDEDSLSVKDKEVRDSRWRLICDLVYLEPEIYSVSQRGQMIARAIVDHQASKPRLYRVLRRYWQRGKSPNALLPDFNKCGARGKAKTPGEKKLGRPRKHGDFTGINLSEKDKQIMRVSVKRFYQNDHELSLASAYNSMLRAFYTQGVHVDAHERETPVLPHDGSYPSLRQFRYWYEKESDIRKTIIARRGKIAYAKDHRPVLRTSTAEVLGPGSRYQIDATIADVYLVSRLDPSKIVGRPVLYFIVDVFSRMIVGIYVGLEGPSWITAMMAIANAAEDKVEYCKRFGIEIASEDWPSCYLPNAIIGDRGEMVGRGVDNLVNNFGVRVENTPPYRPDWKGIVEKYFHTMQAKFRPHTPGYVKPDFQQRGARDYRLDATFNLEDFTKMVVEIVINHNLTNELANYDASEFLIPTEVPLVPIDLWNWGIINRSGRLKSHDSADVRLSLLPRESASVTEFGIEFHKCLYGCDSALQGRWFEKARMNGRWKISVSYDPRCMDTIYLNHHESSSFEACNLLERSRQFSGQSLWEIEEALAAQKDAKANRQQRRLQSQIALDHRLEGYKKDALNRRNGALPELSKAEKIRDIRSNRKLERDVQRSLESFVATPLPGKEVRRVDVLSPTQEDEIDDDLELLRSVRNRHEGFVRWSDDNE